MKYDLEAMRHPGPRQPTFSHGQHVGCSLGLRLSLVGAVVWMLGTAHFGARARDGSDRGLDVLTLVGGARVEGHILNKTLRLQSAYGALELPVGLLAGVRFPQDNQWLQDVLTLSSNKLSGFITDEVVRVALPHGSTSEIRLDRLEYIAIHSAESNTAPGRPTQWVRLRNGDRLSGTLVVDSLSLIEQGTEKSFRTADLVSLSFSTNRPPKVSAQLKGNETRKGTLTVEEVDFRLGWGASVRLPLNLISGIGASETGESVPVNGSSNVIANSRERVLSSVTNQASWVWIPAGEFLMGSPTEEFGRDADEGPQTRVVIAQGFWMCKYEVTQGIYQAVMGGNPSNGTGDADRPVERVTWFEAVDFCRQLTEMTAEVGSLPKGYAYRLPTEAEWEYACRAGTTTRFSFGEDKTAAQLPEYAWFTRNAESVTHPVGSRRPNAWGLYDMHGNVWEWCLDRWEDALPGGRVTNSVVSATGTLRVARGGSWLYEPKACRSANRDDYSPWDRCSDLGFRIVLALHP